ncbi:hypothetical protein MSG28_008401 [Choristoneura fumiferana]|uniref:Uncharacterized protein n=1 Tax=Choristoneura fumiferana TaxID=7141 RepID=A0ACC0J6C9_CHOFU|nr:hypothetical protein MSG28_008401 [Choristoneura fumiferana]
MWMKAKWLVLWSLWVARLARQPTVPLRVSGGRVRGSVAHDGSHTAYLGIPYASLTEDNRFQAPGPEPTWEGVYDAIDDKVTCYQSTMVGAILMGREDCLALNVFTPVYPADTPLPIMVFIHGGGFIEGSGAPLIYGPNYLVPKGVILVTFNYRLNVHGFLSLGIKEAPGNAGMKDQVAALRWVQRNIRVFGGDPDNVTIFGESAGGASVSYHLLSLMSVGLFHKAITQSGSSLMAWAQQATPEHIARRVAKAMGYVTEDPYELYKIFKNKPLEELTQVKLPLDKKKTMLSRHIFAPSVEKIFDGVEPFLTKDPYQLFLSGEYNKVPMIVGTNSDEGYLFVGVENPLVVPNVDIEDSLPNDLVFPSASEKKRVAEEVKKMYMGDEPISEAPIAQFKISRFYGEPFFNFPSMAESELLLNSSGQPLYHYYFNYDGWRNIGKFVSGPIIRSSTGMSHGDDIFYLFYQPFIPAWFDMEMINRVTTMWTNFAKYGDPTPETTALLPLRWLPARKEAPQALAIDKELSIIPMWHRESLKFWKHVYSKYRRKC